MEIIGILELISWKIQCKSKSNVNLKGICGSKKRLTEVLLVSNKEEEAREIIKEKEKKKEKKKTKKIKKKEKKTKKKIKKKKTKKTKKTKKKTKKN